MKAFTLSLFIFCLSFTFFSANILGQDSDIIDYSTPTAYEIGGITISGIEYLDETVLLTLVGMEVGDKINIPGDEIPAAITSLWKQGLFSDVKIYASKIINDVIFLDINLKERVRMSRYSFDGVRPGEEDDLRDRISLVRGRIVTENLINNTQNSIKDFYYDKGFLNTTVEISQQPDDSFANGSELTIKVRKGNKVRINEISFHDNTNMLSRKLKKQMKDTKERTHVREKALKNLWGDIRKSKFAETMGNISVIEAMQYFDENLISFKPFSSSKYIEDDFTIDKENIIAYYNENGYRDARIISDSVYQINQKHLNIDIDVEEGQQYFFRDIEWKGNSKYGSELLSEIVGIDKGDIYNQSLLQQRLFMDPNGNDVSSLYMDDGYLFFQVTPVEKTVEADSIDLLINVYEGPQATIDKILINGNTKTNEHVIRRELRSLPGSKFSRKDIIRSQREIANLGYFDPEQIQINPIPNPEAGTVDIEYTVAEKPSDQLELSAGWGGNSIVGSIGVSFNNFSIRNAFKKGGWSPLPSGDGQRLSFRFQSTGRAFQSISTSFTEPWLGGRRPNAFTVSLYSTRSWNNSTITDFDSDDASILLITGASVGLGRRLRFPDDNFTLQTTLNYQHYNLRNWFSDFIITDGTSNNLNLNMTLARYSLDQPIYPRSGSNISLSMQITPPFSALSGKDYGDLSLNKRYKWAEYHKWKFKAEWYTSIVGNLVLKASAKMGLMGYYNNDIGHSPFERFEVGDDGISNFNLYGKDIISLRGYEVITNNRVQLENGRTTNVGDPFFAKYTVELRYPLSLNPSSTIYLLAFVEGGNSWNTFTDFNPFEVDRSAGLGLRIFLPMFGTLGFDYGAGFDKNVPSSLQGGSFGNYLSNYGKFSVVLGIEPE